MSVVTSMLIPPPGTNPGVQSLYYAQNAQLAYGAVKGLGSVAGKLVSQKVAQKVAQSVLVKATQNILNAVRQNITKAISMAIQKALGRAVATAVVKSGAQHTVLLAAGPIGAVVDGLVTCIQVFGLLFTMFDKSGIAFVMDSAFIKNITNGMNDELNKALEENGMPGYYSDEATFPVENFVFEQDKDGNPGIRKTGWGQTYLKFQDDYMSSKGFKKNWRDSFKDVKKTPENHPKKKLFSFPSSSDNNITLVVVGVAILFFILLAYGIYYVATM